MSETTSIEAVQALSEVAPQEAATTTRYRQLGWNDCIAAIRAALVGRPPTPHPTQEKP